MVNRKISLLNDIKTIITILLFPKIELFGKKGLNRTEYALRVESRCAFRPRKSL